MKNFTTVFDALIRAREDPVIWDYVGDFFTMEYGAGFNPLPAFIRDVHTGKLKAVRVEPPKKKLGKVADYLETLHDENAPCPGIFIMYSRYDEDFTDNYFDVLLFKAEDIFAMKNITTWDRLSGGYCSDDESRTAVRSLDNNRVLVELTQTGKIPQPIHYCREQLALLLNALIVDSNTEMFISCFLVDAAGFICDLYIRTDWLPADLTGSIPMPYCDEEGFVMNDDYYDQEVRKSILSSYVNLYHTLLEVREKLHDEIRTED